MRNTVQYSTVTCAVENHYTLDENDLQYIYKGLKILRTNYNLYTYANLKLQTVKHFS